jgi:hypothetical protein
MRTSTSHDHAVPDDECLYQVRTGEAVLERYELPGATSPNRLFLFGPECDPLISISRCDGVTINAEPIRKLCILFDYELDCILTMPK